MSSALAIAGVTAVLRTVLNDGLTARNVAASTGGSFAVTALGPDRIAVAAGSELSQLNLFLYQVTPNPGWRNRELPTRDGNGDRTCNTPLALDLHYLLTAYGASELFAEILLGHAMQLLHEGPAIPRTVIRKVLSQLAALAQPVDLTSSELAEQLEQIKVTPESLSLDDMSRLWSALSAHYRPSAAYVATTVIIESQRPARIALPVQQPMIAVRPLRRPSIARITSDAGEGAPIMTSENLVIEGTALDAEFVRVTSGGADVTDAITLRRDDRIEVTLATATGLRAGRQAVQVTHLTDLPPNDRTIAESNAMAYTLHPAVAATVVASAADPTDNALRTGSIQLTFDPLVTAGQRIMMLLNERAPAAGAAARAYSFPAPPGNGIVAPATDAATVVVRFNRVAPGSYLVRVDVDGAASVLEIAGGSYAKPAVAV